MNKLTLYDNNKLSLPNKIKNDLDNILTVNLYPNVQTTYDIIRKKYPDITFETLNDGRKTREKKIDFVKLSKGK